MTFGSGETSRQPALPAGFLLGTATAAHQVEGGNTRNDWARFEEMPGRVKGGERSGRRPTIGTGWPEDIALMQRLGANAYRFSVEWSRLEPSEGQWNEAAAERYRSWISKLGAAGIRRW